MHICKHSLSVALLVFLSQSIFAQVVSTIPVFPTVHDSVTIIYDATKGNAALDGVPPPIYAHTGVITNESVSLSDWKHVQGTWGVADPHVLMTEISPNLYKIKYKIDDYYGLVATDTVYQMAFVFRNTDGSIVGRDDDGSDIYVNVYEPGLNVSILTPAVSPYLTELGDNIHISAAATFCDSIFLYIDDVLIESLNDSSISYDITAAVYGTHEIKVKAKNAIETKTDSTNYFVRPPITVADVPVGIEQGINYINDSTVTLVLYAPFKNYVFAIGDYSDWQINESNYMNVSPDLSTYWVTLTHLIPGKEYAFQYFIDGNLTVADPLAEKILDPNNDSYISATTYPDLMPYPTGKTTGIVSVLQTNKPIYDWAITDFTPPADKDLVVYELLIRDFTSARNYQTLLDTLNYLKTLGINAIELMPIMEFEGNESWGYNPSFFTALDKYYGTPEAFKQFIDAAHADGIAIILDIAMNHAFGQCPLVQMWFDSALGITAANNPYFNQYPTHDYNVGYDFNHESPATKKFRTRVFNYWVNEYHIDGYRFDLSKGYTQTNTLGNVAEWGHYDASRVATWQSIADSLRATKSNVVMILEHFADNDEEEVLSNYGFLLWGNLNYNYNQATMGYSSSDLSWGSYEYRGWDDPHLVTYMESHDEERLMYKNITYGNTSNPDYSCKDENTALARMEAAAAFFFTIPGPKMVWQFGELGYDYSIDYGCRVCSKPVRWDYYSNPNRYRLYQVYAALIHLKEDYPVFGTTNYTLNVSGLIKSIHLNDVSMNVTVLGNFQVTGGTINPAFQHTGKWYEYFSGDSITVTDVTAAIDLPQGVYKLYTDKRLQTPEIIEAIPTAENNQDQHIFIYPNPTSGEVHMQIDLPENADVDIAIINMLGETIYTHSEQYNAGTQTFIWNGTTQKNIQAESGIYVCRITAGKYRYTSKITIQ